LPEFEYNWLLQNVTMLQLQEGQCNSALAAGSHLNPLIGAQNSNFAL